MTKAELEKMKRPELDKLAEELKLNPSDYQNVDEIVLAITAEQAKQGAGSPGEDPEALPTPVDGDSKKTKYYKSVIFGLSVTVDPGKGGDYSEEKRVAKFVPYQFKIEVTGEIQKFGLYKTEDAETCEVLAGTQGVEEIDKESYKLLAEKGSRLIK